MTVTRRLKATNIDGQAKARRWSPWVARALRGAYFFGSSRPASFSLAKNYAPGGVDGSVVGAPANNAKDTLFGNGTGTATPLVQVNTGLLPTADQTFVFLMKEFVSMSVISLAGNYFKAGTPNLTGDRVTFYNNSIIAYGGFYDGGSGSPSTDNVSLALPSMGSTPPSTPQASDVWKLIAVTFDSTAKTVTVRNLTEGTSSTRTYTALVRDLRSDLPIHIGGVPVSALLNNQYAFFFIHGAVLTAAELAEYRSRAQTFAAMAGFGSV